MDEQTPTDADAALARLRALLAAAHVDEEAPELIRLADLAADPEVRAKVAEALIAALTVIRFAPLFGHDPEPGRKQAEAILAAFAAG